MEKPIVDLFDFVKELVEMFSLFVLLVAKKMMVFTLLLGTIVFYISII